MIVDLTEFIDCFNIQFFMDHNIMKFMYWFIFRQTWPWIYICGSIVCAHCQFL